MGYTCYTGFCGTRGGIEKQVGEEGWQKARGRGSPKQRENVGLVSKAVPAPAICANLLQYEKKLRMPLTRTRHTRGSTAPFASLVKKRVSGELLRRRTQVKSIAMQGWRRWPSRPVDGQRQPKTPRLTNTRLRINIPFGFDRFFSHLAGAGVEEFPARAIRIASLGASVK